MVFESLRYCLLYFTEYLPLGPLHPSKCRIRRAKGTPGRIGLCEMDNAVEL
jgi:hypothetical protein